MTYTIRKSIDQDQIWGGKLIIITIIKDLRGVVLDQMTGEAVIQEYTPADQGVNIQQLLRKAKTLTLTPIIINNQEKILITIIIKSLKAEIKVNHIKMKPKINKIIRPNLMIIDEETRLAFKIKQIIVVQLQIILLLMSTIKIIITKATINLIANMETIIITTGNNHPI